MKSPGIPDKVSLVKQIREKGIQVVSEIEFAAKFTDATIVGRQFCKTGFRRRF